MIGRFFRLALMVSWTSIVSGCHPPIPWLEEWFLGARTRHGDRYPDCRRRSRSHLVRRPFSNGRRAGPSLGRGHGDGSERKIPALATPRNRLEPLLLANAAGVSDVSPGLSGVPTRRRAG